MHTTGEQVLSMLRAQGDWVSGESICAALQVSRTSVWKHIQSLRTAGYEVESAPRRGYRLAAAPDLPLPAEIRRFLAADAPLAWAPQFPSSVDSTNRFAADLARRDAPEGTVVVADHQTAGRGRLSRTWFSPPGVNLYFSLVLRPAAPPLRTPQLSLVAALALIRTVRAVCPQIQPGIKWPNDVLVEGRKLSGILCDMSSEMDRVHYLILGVGINVNVAPAAFPPELQETATSLLAASGQPVSRPRLLAEFLNHFGPLYVDWLANGLEPLLAELEARSVLSGQEVAVTEPRATFFGTALGMTADGALRVRLADGNIRNVVCGDLSVRSRLVVGVE